LLHRADVGGHQHLHDIGASRGSRLARDLEDTAISFL